MRYNLKFKKKGERGYWYTSVNADNEEDAIKKAKEFLKDNDNVEKVVLEQLRYSSKKIWEGKVNE